MLLQGAILSERIIANALIEERWRNPEVPSCGRVAGKQDICTVEARECSGKASPGRFQGHRENLRASWQTYTFTCTLPQFLKITRFICLTLRANSTHLKSAGRKAVGVQVPLWAPIESTS